MLCWHQARDAYQSGCVRCYPLGGSHGARESTTGQPAETHTRGDASFMSLNGGFKRAAKAANMSLFVTRY